MLGKCKTCQNYVFFYIFYDILDRRKANVGQEYVERGLLSFQGKNGTIVSDFP